MNPAIYFSLLLFILPLFYIIFTKKASKRLPPEQWPKKRARKYRPVSKFSLFRRRTVFLHGQDANKFIFPCDGITLAHQPPPSFRWVVGKKNMTGVDRRRPQACEGSACFILEARNVKGSAFWEDG
ncbi:hypothetical protein WN944_012059 [Citrus x changshan-huyou]|uniref:Uncharacterized protein n=1 Tax=Citrus x changshan-huyou TaxID=2935761 RepID=A0AAP0MUI9_9ROSI